MHFAPSPQTARITMPRCGLADSHFVYTPAEHTSVATTFAQERLRLRNEALQREMQAIQTQQAQAAATPRPTRKVRAGGMGQQLDLPSL